MENLTNEQIIDIIKFYEKCGVPEETYLSKDGALDLFTLLKIKPEFDEDGNRKLTPYELLEVLPKFEDGHEVPIVFAIKHKANKVVHGGAVSGEFTFAGARKSDSMDILNKFKQDYFNAMDAVNVGEATRVFNLIDKLTGGHAEEVLGVKYNYEMFYIKMKRQLLIDLFANFLILRIMNRKSQVKEGIVKADKLYKEFVETQEKQLTEAGIGAGGNAPVLEDVNIVITQESEDDEEEKKTEFSSTKLNQSVTKQTQEVVKQHTIAENIESFIKEKFEKIKTIRKTFGIESEKQEQKEETKEPEQKVEKSEKLAAVLESD